MRVMRRRHAWRCVTAAFTWRPLAGGVMIGAEVDRMTSRVGESRVPKYGGLMQRSKID
jgi:hypothetical protein